MFEWDEAKSAKTLKERGFGFDIMEGFLWDYALCVEIQEDSEEAREKWIAPIDQALYVAVMVPRDTVMRVISLRLATQREIVFWRQEIADA